MNKMGLFVGTERGYETLKVLLKNKRRVNNVLILVQEKHEIVNVTNKIAKLCKKHHIPFDFSTNIKPSSYKDYLLRYKPDAVFCVGWRFLISKECLAIPRRGIFVLHDTLLPYYRGMATTTWPLINGEEETGLTLIYADAEMDSGDIVDQIKIKISKRDTGRTMNNKYLKLIPRLILKNMDSILAGTNKRTPQDASLATYGCKRTPQDGKIDFGKTTKEIVRLIKALTYPYPGVFCYYRGEKVLIWQASELKNPPIFVGRIAGRVISVSKNGHVDVLTSDGVLRITKIAFADNPNKFLIPNTVFRSLAQSLL